jgi:hypothetical protein
MFTPYKEDGKLCNILELLYNKQHKQGRLVADYAFSMMKHCWKEMLEKIDMYVSIMPNMFICYYILHNLFIKKKMRRILMT